MVCVDWCTGQLAEAGLLKKFVTCALYVLLLLDMPDCHAEHIAWLTSMLQLIDRLQGPQHFGMRTPETDWFKGKQCQCATFAT